MLYMCRSVYELRMRSFKGSLYIYFNSVDHRNENRYYGSQIEIAKISKSSLYIFLLMSVPNDDDIVETYRVSR